MQKDLRSAAAAIPAQRRQTEMLEKHCENVIARFVQMPLHEYSYIAVPHAQTSLAS